MLIDIILIYRSPASWALMTKKSRESLSYVLLALVICAISYLYGETLFDIGRICWSSDDYSHGLILPFVTAYIFHSKREELFQRLRRQTRRGSTGGAMVYVTGSALLGATLLVLGTLLYFVGVISYSLFARWLSFFAVTLGTAYLVFGPTIGNFVIGPVGLLLMAKPLPDSLVPKLFSPFQTLAAAVSARTLDWLGVPVHLIGNIIEIPGMRLAVEEACSGMRSLMALVTVALIVLQLIDLRFIAKVGLVLFSIFIAITLNVLRVCVTGILAHFYDPTSATGFFHTFSGMIVFGLGLIILYAAGTVLSRYSWAKVKRDHE